MKGGPAPKIFGAGGDLGSQDLNSPNYNYHHCPSPFLPNITILTGERIDLMYFLHHAIDVFHHGTGTSISTIPCVEPEGNLMKQQTHLEWDKYAIRAVYNQCVFPQGLNLSCQGRLNKSLTERHEILLLGNNESLRSVSHVAWNYWKCHTCIRSIRSSMGLNVMFELKRFLSYGSWIVQLHNRQWWPRIATSFCVFKSEKAKKNKKKQIYTFARQNMKRWKWNRKSEPKSRWPS